MNHRKGMWISVINSRASWDGLMSIVLSVETLKLGVAILLLHDNQAILTSCVRFTNEPSSPTATMRHFGKSIFCNCKQNLNTIIELFIYYVHMQPFSVIFLDRSPIIGCSWKKRRIILAADSYICNCSVLTVYFPLFSAS